MAKLNQILAIEKGIKSKALSEMSQAYKAVQKKELFYGFSKDYQKLDEEGEDLPSEKKKVGLRVKEIIDIVFSSFSELLEITARKDWSNQLASADVVVGDTIIIPKCPVTYLLFLDKQLVDLKTFLANTPVLDETEDWSYDAVSELHKTPPIKTHRTKKTSRPIVMYDATPEHPAQTHLVAEDVVAGHWITVKQSGALTKGERETLVSRVEKLLKAVKQAREAANIVDETEPPQIREMISTYLFN